MEALKLQNETVYIDVKGYIATNEVARHTSQLSDFERKIFDKMCRENGWDMSKDDMYTLVTLQARYNGNWTINLNEEVLCVIDGNVQAAVNIINALSMIPVGALRDAEDEKEIKIILPAICHNHPQCKVFTTIRISQQMMMAMPFENALYNAAGRIDRSRLTYNPNSRMRPIIVNTHANVVKIAQGKETFRVPQIATVYAESGSCITDDVNNKLIELMEKFHHANIEFGEITTINQVSDIPNGSQKNCQLTTIMYTIDKEFDVTYEEV